MLEEENALKHQTTLRIFLLMKFTGKETGVRDTQRLLGMTSPSTISWHLDKLVDVGLIEKLRNNKYVLSDNGKEYNDIKIQITQSLFFFRGFFFPRLVFVISFLMFGLITTVVLLLINSGRMSIFINAFFTILVALLMILREWYQVQKQLSIYHQKRDED